MSTEVLTTGRMDKGHLHVRNRDRFRGNVSRLKDGEVEIIVRRKHATRTLAANSYYWGVIIHELSEYTGFTPEEMHDFLKMKFLPPQALHKLVVHKPGGVEVNQFLLHGSTTRLNTPEFYEYCLAIKVWAATDLAVAIPDPNEVAA